MVVETEGVDPSHGRCPRAQQLFPPKEALGEGIPSPNIDLLVALADPRHGEPLLAGRGRIRVDQLCSSGVIDVGGEGRISRGAKCIGARTWACVAWPHGPLRSPPRCGSSAAATVRWTMRSWTHETTTVHLAVTTRRWSRTAPGMVHHLGRLFHDGLSGERGLP